MGNNYFEILKNVIKEKKIIVFVIVIIALTLGCTLVLLRYFLIVNDNEKSYDDDIFEVNDLNANKKEEQEEDFIKVHIVGSVNVPGLYELKVGSRVDDAINIAGGLKDDANVDVINLAEELSDGQKLKIKSINDIDTDNLNELESNNDLKININTATVLELKNLQGIGESTAIRIVEYRNKNGRFKSIEDLKNVSGIGESKFESIKDKIKTK